jgi:hypothetical protein
MILQIIKNIIHPASKYSCIGYAGKMYNRRGESQSELLERRAVEIKRCFSNNYPVMTREEYYALPISGDEFKSKLQKYRLDIDADTGAVFEFLVPQKCRFRDGQWWLTKYNLVG